MKRSRSAGGPNEVWTSGEAYESFVGRWSRAVAREFLEWLEIPGGSRWLDVGCGTGALSATILEMAAPSRVHGIDPSIGYLEFARSVMADDRARFETADAQALPVESAGYDAVVSGLALNFIPRPDRALAEMARAARRGGTVAAYVWDYAGKMQFMRHFWDAAAALDPRAKDLDEGGRFPICHPEPLREIFQKVDLAGVEVRAIDTPTDFNDFDDFWSPFLGGQGPAPGYVMSLGEGARSALRERLRAGLPYAANGSIHLVARAWAVRGVA